MATIKPYTCADYVNNEYVHTSERKKRKKSPKKIIHSLLGKHGSKYRAVAWKLYGERAMILSYYLKIINDFLLDV